MKTLPALAFIAAFAAFFLLPVNFVTTVSVIFGAGLVAMLIADYGRGPRTITLPTASVVALAPQRSERFGLAA
jgi:hypothetical protein